MKLLVFLQVFQNRQFICNPALHPAMYRYSLQGLGKYTRFAQLEKHSMGNTSTFRYFYFDDTTVFSSKSHKRLHIIHH
jgi:hypothetical protein